MEQTLGHVEDPLTWQADLLEGVLEIAGIGLVAANLLRGDDPVERDLKPGLRAGEEIVVAVGDDGKPEAAGQAR